MRFFVILVIIDVFWLSKPMFTSLQEIPRNKGNVSKGLRNYERE